MNLNIKTRNLGLTKYQEVFEAMVNFTQSRSETSPDEIWVCEHEDVYTLGKKADTSNILNFRNIPVCQTDRGGEVTYHGPGQIVVYPLINLRRYSLLPKDYLNCLLSSGIETLLKFDVEAQMVDGAPGLFVFQENLSPPPFQNLNKIASVGIKISRGCTYHGMSFNWNVDLKKFQGINPCGFKKLINLNITSLSAHADKSLFISEFTECLKRKIGKF